MTQRNAPLGRPGGLAGLPSGVAVRDSPLGRPGGLMPPEAWNRYRSEHMRRLAAYRRNRAVSLGPHMRLQFEDELTVRWHIQEVLRVERIERPAEVQEEVQRYAHLCPDGTEWIATLMIQIPDAALRQARLPELARAAHQVFVQLDAAPRTRLFAQANEDLPDRHLGRDSAVHFLRFAWSAEARAAVARGAGVRLGCTHPGYEFVRLLPGAVLASLRRDLAPPVERGTAPAAPGRWGLAASGAGG
jgi:Protein of unknown function (DUF3501)